MVAKQLLLDTFLFRNAYAFFGVQSDNELISKMSTITIFTTIAISIAGGIIPAPYGRYLKSTRFSLNARLSWMIQESPFVLVPIILLVGSPCVHTSSFPNLLGIGLFMLHYAQRTFIYPFRVSKEARPVPIWSVALAFTVAFWNGFYQGHHLLNVSLVQDDNVSVLSGFLIFALGLAINTYHDQILINLSKNRKQNKDGSNAYEIPRGGLFEYISGANYLGEIIEWWGYAIVTRQFPQIMWGAFSTQFLGQRAIHHHKFYKETFGKKYPSDRRAIIPFFL